MCVYFVRAVFWHEATKVRTAGKKQKDSKPLHYITYNKICSIRTVSSIREPTLVYLKPDWPDRGISLKGRARDTGERL